MRPLSAADLALSAGSAPVVAMPVKDAFGRIVGAWQGAMVNRPETLRKF